MGCDATAGVSPGKSVRGRGALCDQANALGML